LEIEPYRALWLVRFSAKAAPSDFQQNCAKLWEEDASRSALNN